MAAAASAETDAPLRPVDISELPVIYVTEEGLDMGLSGAEEPGEGEARDGAGSHLLVQVPPAYGRQQQTHQNDFCEYWVDAVVVSGWT